MDTESNHPRTGNGNMGTSSSSGQKRRCANCDIEILWSPVVVQGITYCCTGCAAGGPCNCDYSQYRSVNIAGVIHYDVEEGDADVYSSSMSEDRPKQQ